MTRRRIIFTDKESGIRYMTPEFNGDKQEFEQFVGDNGDKCTATWAEIAEIFRPVMTLEEFRAANKAAQARYISSIAPNAKILPIELIPDTTIVAADELLFLPVPEGGSLFSDREFKERMLRSGSDLLADFLGRDFLILSESGNTVGTIDIEAEINAVFAQMPCEEIQKYWRLMLETQGERDE